MGSIFAHLAVGLLSFVFPSILDLPSLLFASMLPDIEYAYIIGKDFIKKTKMSKLTLNAFSTGFFHSLIGVYLVQLPLSVLLLYLSYPLFGWVFVLNKVLISLLFGFTLHLILDLPAHPYLMLFYPFKKLKNPFLINLKWDLLKKIYPYKKIEHSPYVYMREFNWIILSTLLAIFLFAFALL